MYLSSCALYPFQIYQNTSAAVLLSMHLQQSHCHTWKQRFNSAHYCDGEASKKHK